MSSKLTAAQKRQLTKLLKETPPVYEIAPKEFAEFEKAAKALATKITEQVQAKNIAIAKSPIAMQQVIITKVIEPFVFPTYIPYKIPEHIPQVVPQRFPYKEPTYVPQISFVVDMKIPAETYRIIAKEALARVNRKLVQ